MENKKWENKLKLIWEDFGKIPNEQFINSIKLHILDMPNYIENPIAKFELACAYDSTSNEQLAAPLYRESLSLGLNGLRRRRATIQLASTLRNLGKISESIELLRAEKENYSDELNDAVDGFLALSLYSMGNHCEALSIVLKALSAHLPRYNQSMYNYATNLKE